MWRSTLILLVNLFHKRDWNWGIISFTVNAISNNRLYFKGLVSIFPFYFRLPRDRYITSA